MIGQYDGLRNISTPKPKVTAPTAKPAPRFVQVDTAKIEATGYAKGFKAASVRVALIMGSPIVRGNEAHALKLLASPDFMTMSAQGFLKSFAAAMEQKAVAAWPSVIAKLNQRTAR